MIGLIYRIKFCETAYELEFFNFILLRLDTLHSAHCNNRKQQNSLSVNCIDKDLLSRGLSHLTKKSCNFCNAKSLNDLLPQCHLKTTSLNSARSLHTYTLFKMKLYKVKMTIGY